MAPRILTPACTLFVVLTAHAAERASLPIVLFENHGQAPHDVRFVLQYQHLRALYRNDGVLFRDGATSIIVRFSGQSPSARITALDPIQGRANFLQGSDAAAWIRDVQLYSGLAY